MITNYQYKAYPLTTQKLELNDWLRIGQHWYNRQLGERFNWWQNNSKQVKAFPWWKDEFPLIFNKPNYYSQKKQLPSLKKKPVTVEWSGESLDYKRLPANTLQEISKRVEKSFSRFVAGDKNGNRSGKPRFKNKARFRTLVFEGAGLELHSCSLKGKWLWIKVPKIGVLKVRHHRPLPDGFVLSQLRVTKKNDGWYATLTIKDASIPPFEPDPVVPTWDNTLGMDAVLHEDDYLATSEGVKLPSLKSFRKSQSKLVKVATKRNKAKKGSKVRRKLAKQEARIHTRIARARRDHAYKTANALVKTGKKVFAYEKLNLKGLTKRCKPKQDEAGKFLPNGQSAKSGLNKSWADAGFGQFFTVLKYVAEKAGAIAVAVNPAYTSQLLSYRDEFVFTDTSIRSYWDEKEQLNVDRDINAGINIKRVALDEFVTIKRCKGKPVIKQSKTDSTSKEVLSTLRSLEKPTLQSI